MISSILGGLLAGIIIAVCLLLYLQALRFRTTKRSLAILILGLVAILCAPVVVETSKGDVAPTGVALREDNVQFWTMVISTFAAGGILWVRGFARWIQRWLTGPTSKSKATGAS
ncbi:MAG: hypothetical protein FWF75_01405 [Propionibacteriaceae bacterium]|nr:hypothetical protein [Propionibacteriaceae bacterium]